MIGYDELAKRARRTDVAWRQYVENATVREILMGAQDNLTNVLAVVMGVAVGSGRVDFVVLAGLSAGVAEAISMGGVLYNATRAERRVASRRGRELGRPDAAEERLGPLLSGIVTFLAAMVAAFVPLAPFFVLPLSAALVGSVAASVAALFLLGAVVGRLGGERWWREGTRLLAVAGIAAVAAASVGAVLQVH